MRCFNRTWVVLIQGRSWECATLWCPLGPAILLSDILWLQEWQELLPKAKWLCLRRTLSLHCESDQATLQMQGESHIRWVQAAY